MAVYAYVCEDGHRFEDIKPMARKDEETPCDVCGKPSRRVPTQAGPPGGGDTPKFYPGRF